MGGEPTPLLVLGGNSAIGQHILALVPQARALARSAGVDRVDVIGSYNEIGLEAFVGVRTVINCTGLVQGRESELRRVNADLQQALAEKARAAGVARYVAISSFSIFGARERIWYGLEPAPIDAYGRSKLEGEQRLAGTQAEGFGVLNVAFPAIIGTNSRGKVERMIQLWRRVGRWPAPPGDVSRSMIGAEAAARVLVAAAHSDSTGRVLAADPVPFTYERAAQWMRDDLGAHCTAISVPCGVVGLLRRVAPRLHRSLMTDSLLESDDNFMLAQKIESSLRSEFIAAARRKSIA